MQDNRGLTSIAKENYRRIVMAVNELSKSDSKLFSQPIDALKLDAIINDFESRIKEFKFNTNSVNANPIIVDIGCGDFPHFFLMTALFPQGFTYFGIDKYPPSPNIKEAENLINVIKTQHPNFNFKQVDLFNNAQVNQLLIDIYQLTGKNKADLILVENLAVGGSDNEATDMLMKRVIGFVPYLLAEPGLMHIEAASHHQSKLVNDLLIENNIPFVKTDLTNFACAMAVKFLSDQPHALPPLKK